MNNFRAYTYMFHILTSNHMRLISMSSADTQDWETVEMFANMNTCKMLLTFYVINFNYHVF